jgi:hypothetical protein
VRYYRPLETVLDSFFENYVKWKSTTKDHQYEVYNVSFSKYSPIKRDINTIAWADLIIVPSDSEFRYHGELQMNPKDLAKSESHMETIRPFFENKRVIVWRSDRADDADLYRNHTFRGVNLKSLDFIDEVEFSGNIHGMKWHFIQSLETPFSKMVESPKKIDFGYWGRMKHGNSREETIREIYRDKDLTSVLIGGMPSGVKRASKWIKDWRQLYPIIKTSRFTLCFNWIDETATTSRYPEALSVGIIPFVWGSYDVNNTYKISAFQRVDSFKELKERGLELRDASLFNEKLEEYRCNYKEVLLSEKEYFEEFSKRMNDLTSP